jgi:hypothetical protein
MVLSIRDVLEAARTNRAAVATNLFAADICVRQGTVGGTGSGADWTNAKTQIPTTFTRGDTIWVAGGSGYTFSIDRGNIAMNSTTVLTIKYPTAAAHGPSTGWSDSFTNAPADFNPSKIAASYIGLDGSVGGGPGNFTNNCGFRFFSLSPGVAPFIMISDTFGGPSDRVNVTNVLITHCEVGSTNTPGIGEGISAVAAGAQFINITNSFIYMHDMGSDPWKINNSDGFVLDSSYFARNGSDGSHHNSVVHFNGYLLNFRISNNWFEDFVGTGGIGGYDNTGTNGNIFNNIITYRPTGILSSAVSTNWGNGAFYTLNNSSVGINY